MAGEGKWITGRKMGNLDRDGEKVKGRNWKEK